MRNDIIYNLLFRFRDIDLNNINDIYFAINIIIIITTTLFETLIASFILKLIIIIIINVDIVIIIVIVIIIIAFEKPVIKLIIFDFDIKRRFAINASFNKS